MPDAVLDVLQDHPQAPGTERMPDGGAPMPEAQLGLWYAQRLDPSNPVFNTAQYVELHGPLNVAALASAVRDAMREADGLAVRVDETSGDPRLVPDPLGPATLEVMDLSGAPDPARTARQLMRDDLRTPIDPTAGGLVAQRLFVLAPDHHFWYQRIHHLVVDAYGSALLTYRVSELYAAHVAGRATAGTPLPPFSAVVKEDAEYRESGRREADRSYWLSELEQHREAPRLSTGAPVSAHEYLQHSAQLPESVAPALHALAAEARVGWPDALVALTAAYIARHVASNTVVLGVPSMNRLGSAAARVPTMMMNVLPVPATIEEDVSVTSFVAGFARRMQVARRHGRYRAEQIRRDMGLVGYDRWLHGPIVNVVPFDVDPVLTGLITKLHPLATGPVDDLTISLRGDSTGRNMRLEIDANPALYTESELEAHAERLAHFLDAAARAERLVDVPTLTPHEHRRWIVDVNATEHPVPDTTLVALMEATMQRAPEATAMVDGERTFTYAEFDELTGALAHRLYRAGVRRGDIVAVAIPRSAELLISLVAILRAGAAYLPLDTEHPPARNARVLQSANPRLVIADCAGRAALPADAENVLEISSRDTASRFASALEAHDTGDATGTAHGSAIVHDSPTPDDLAYVLYTSGSTGDPKGVMIEHRAIVNRLEWMRVHYGIGSDDRILQKTPTTFDVSVWELFLPFTCGATLVVTPPGAHRDPAHLCALVREQRITTMHFVPSMLAAVLDDPASEGLEVRRVICSGEALPAALRDRFHGRIRAELHNLYGPTEAAVDVTFWDASAGDDSNPIPIGFPVWNTRLYVLDHRMRPVPPGVPGELYLAGVQLARGYLGRPDLTEERFVPDPFGQPGDRMYRTGDVAQWREDGAVEFLGRADDQVKLRGQRIEPGEIEAALLTCDGVAQAAVLLREDRPGDARLVAYMVPSGPDESPDSLAIRSRLAAMLPEAMVPSAYVWLPELPLTTSGKLNRRALPAPEVTAELTGRAPETPTEKRVAAAFADALGIPVSAIGADDDFFAIGGHSLLAARVATQLRSLVSRDVGLGALFANPTVARLAAHLESVAGRKGSLKDLGLGQVISLSSGTRKDAPALFCVHPAGGIAWCYAPLARALGSSCNVCGLQARALDPDRLPPASLEEMASEYVELVRAEQPHGPYHLLGWSAGGIIAHAMAVQLREQGEEVGIVALLDAYPSDRWRDQPEPDEHAALRALMHIAGHDPAELGAELSREAVTSFLRQRGHPLGALPDEVLTGIVRVVESSNRLVRGHRHRTLDLPVLHFRAALDHEGEDLSAHDWKPYAAVESFNVPALHAHMTAPESAERVAKVLAERIA